MYQIAMDKWNLCVYAWLHVISNSIRIDVEYMSALQCEPHDDVSIPTDPKFGKSVSFEIFCDFRDMAVFSLEFAAVLQIIV